MATMCLAMAMQQTELATTNRLILIFLVMMAVAVMVLAVVLIFVAIKSVKALKDLSATAEDIKVKMLPLLDVAADVGRTGRDLLNDTAPKLKVITSNLVETSDAARSAAKQFDTTITDVNQRTQKQVARVDGMVTAALTTTSEVVEAVAHGIKGPVQRVAAMAGQAWYAAEGLLARFWPRGPRAE